MPYLPPDFAGVKIGQGGTRAVYAHATNPGWVVKVALEGHDIACNVAEWRNDALLTSALGCGDWIAHCLNAAPDYRWLIMERANPLVSGTPICPPVCLAREPRQADNWGERWGRIVCIDYASLNTEPFKELAQKRSHITLS